MRNLLMWSCAFAFAATAVLADSAPAPSPPPKWTLRSDEYSTILLANISTSDLTYVYRICQGDGPATRVATVSVSGQAVILSAGACIDVATQGSLRLTRADATSTIASSGTYQFIDAVPSRLPTPRNS